MKALKFLMPLILLAAVSCTEKGAQTDLKFFDDRLFIAKL